MDFLSPDKGIAIALERLPRLECEVACFRDLPCSIDFAWEEGLPAGPFEPEPPLYWWVREDDDLLACGYCVYQYQDTSHRHDFTGLVILHDKKTDERFAVIRSHFDLPMFRLARLDQVFRIEVNAHPIAIGRGRPEYSRWTPKWKISERTCISHPDHQDDWNRVRKLFKPTVTFPADWDDHYLHDFAGKHLSRWCGLFPDHNLRVTRGLIYNDPKAFLVAAKALGRIQ